VTEDAGRKTEGSQEGYRPLALRQAGVRVTVEKAAASNQIIIFLRSDPYPHQPKNRRPT